MMMTENEDHDNDNDDKVKKENIIKQKSTEEQL
jgi:hypothetical protein